MPPRIWVAAAEEAQTAAALLGGFRDHLGATTPSDAVLLATTERLLTSDPPGAVFLLASAEPGAPAAGVAQLRFRLAVWTGAEDCHLEDLFVREQARGHGLGRGLVDAAVELARSRGCRRIDLDVDEANAPALALYARAGISPLDKYGQTRALFARRAL